MFAQFGHNFAGLLSSFSLPKTSGTLNEIGLRGFSLCRVALVRIYLGASSYAARQIYMGCHPKAQRNIIRLRLPQQGAVNPVNPADGGRVAVFPRSAQQVMFFGKGRPIAAQIQFKITG